MVSRVIIIDRGWMRIKADATQLAGQGVKVGLRSTAGTSADGVRIVDYATFNEFGTEHIPARPFMRRTADTAEGKVSAAAKTLAKNLVAGRLNVNQVLDQLGLLYQSLIRNTIRSTPSWAAPNAPATIRRKKSSVPLIDTGMMLGAVDFERTKIGPGIGARLKSVFRRAA